MRQCIRQPREIGLARDLDGAELRQMAGDELRIQQPEAADL
jgi:hypothetical protein